MVRLQVHYATFIFALTEWMGAEVSTWPWAKFPWDFGIADND